MSKPRDEQNQPNPSCSLNYFFKLLSGEWTIHILWTLSRNGSTRFGELRRQLDGISSKVLTDRLRMLEAEGIVQRESKPTIPPEVSYELTDRGHKLDHTLVAIEHTAKHWTSS
ncbi:MAG: helix-turn-helix domain-containing protein [Wenzhouxiangellaceae bacterium]